jgi:DNA-binding MarR family transcriptional regulator
MTAAPADPDAIARIRRFNRAVTRETGAVAASFLGRGRPLGAARVLTEIARGNGDLRGLREMLGIDSGLLARLLRGLEGEGLVTTAADPADRRRRIARLTPRGTAEVAAYDRLSDTRAARLMARQGRHAAALLAAMEVVTAALLRDRIAFAATDPDDAPARDCMARYFAELDARFPGGFDPGAGSPPDPGALRPPRGVFLVATADGAVFGAVALAADPATPGQPRGGEVKRLWVAPPARGFGLARALMQAVEEQARALGISQLRLDTNATLSEAITLYRRTGWTEVPRYNDNPYAQHWFAKTLA